MSPHSVVVQFGGYMLSPSPQYCGLGPRQRCQVLPSLEQQRAPWEQMGRSSSVALQGTELMLSADQRAIRTEIKQAIKQHSSGLTLLCLLTLQDFKTPLKSAH